MDFFNAMLILLGGWFIIVTLWDIQNKGAVVGTHWMTVLFFTVWAAWNVIWYWHLGQWWTFGATIIFTVLNAIWLWYVVRYSK